ncbi:MAG: hypothetical protein LBE78_12910 [Burkholderiaceae bacterium]|jgi:hypothetical protein|nr:hypothetical protein [Burkholderiaceae bacterium]
MANTQFARGLWSGFAPTENPFGSPNGMDDNLRLIDDHLALYTLAPPVAPGAALPASPKNGDGQVFSDGSYSVFNGGGWKHYPARRGLIARMADGTDLWMSTAAGGWVSLVQVSEVFANLARQYAQQAQIAADAALAGGPWYSSEAEGRAASADGEVFFVVPGTDGAAADAYRRLSSTTSTLLSSYPSTAQIGNFRPFVANPGADLNEISQSGLYLTDTSTNNAPPGLSRGAVLVAKTALREFQLVIGYGDTPFLGFRAADSSGWQPTTVWQKALFTDDVGVFRPFIANPGVNLNELAQSGLYLTNSAVANSPVDLSQGAVLVAKSGNREFQLALGYGATPYLGFRSADSSGWKPTTEWSKVLLSADVGSFRPLIELPGADLNAIAKSGLYIVNSSIANAPEELTQGAVLVAKSGSREFQFAFGYGSGSFCGIRAADSSGWQPGSVWNKVLLRTDVGGFGPSSTYAEDWSALTLNGFYRVAGGLQESYRPNNTTSVINIAANQGRFFQIGMLSLDSVGLEQTPMVVRGKTVTDWTDWGVVLTSNLPSLMTQVLKEEERAEYPFSEFGVFRLAERRSPDFYTGWPGFAYDYQAVIDKYDALVAEFPDYISKRALGTDAFGNTLYEYRLKPNPKSLAGFEDMPVAEPKKICILGGIHPPESIAACSVYELVYGLCHNWAKSPILSKLRSNAQFAVIPIVNASGWATMTRENANGVNINENFPTEWALHLPTSGPSPASEAETQIILNWMQDHLDASCVINVNQTADERWLYWVASRPPYFPLLKRLADKFDPWVKSQVAPGLPDTQIITRMARSGIGQSETHISQTMGIPAFLMESPAGNNTTATGILDTINRREFIVQGLLMACDVALDYALQKDLWRHFQETHP